LMCVGSRLRTLRSWRYPE